MQRYSRDRERDDEGGRSERGAQARNDDRQQGQREAGGRRDPDYERRPHYESATYAASPGSNRWSESPGDRERFEQSYGRGSPQSDYALGGALTGGQQRNEDWRDTARARGTQGEQGGRLPADETEYGMYGPRYSTGSYGEPHGQRGYGERGDDRWNRQDYGQSSWQGESHGRERDMSHHMDSDYQQWRAEQIRNLDEDYRRYRQERYRKFADEFGLWRKSREALQGTPASIESATGNRSGMGSSGGQTTGSGTTDTATKDTPGTNRDSLATGKNTER